MRVDTNTYDKSSDWVLTFLLGQQEENYTSCWWEKPGQFYLPSLGDITLDTVEIFRSCIFFLDEPSECVCVSGHAPSLTAAHTIPPFASVYAHVSWVDCAFSKKTNDHQLVTLTSSAYIL